MCSLQRHPYRRDDGLATTIAPVVTQKKKQTMLHRPQTSHGSRQPTSPASPGKMPPPTPVAPPPQIQAKTQKGSGHTGADNSKRETEDASPPSNTPTVEITSTSDTAMSEANPHTCVIAPTDPTEETKEPGYTDRGGSERETEDASPSSSAPKAEATPTYGATRRDTTLNTCGTTPTDSNEKAEGPGHTGTCVPHSRDRDVSWDTALSQGEHQVPYSTIVQRIADLLRKPRELRARKRENFHLLGKVRDLNNGGTGGEYVTDDDGLLWYAPPGSILRLAIPRSLLPDVLAFVHTTCGHPGVARTTELTQGKYHLGIT